jgi:hypothetical protein
MYVKRALIAALEPPFYRDGLLQHTRAVSHVGEPLQQSAAALVSHYGRRLQHRAAARPCAAAPSHIAVDRCSTKILTPAYRCSNALQRIRAGAAVDGCSILSSGQRCSKPLQHAWLAGWLAGWLAHRSIILSLADRCSTRARAFSYAGVVCCSTRKNSRVAPGESQLPSCCEQFFRLAQV